jgi:hypothetical protein
MIFRDKDGYPVEQSFDGMDSAVRIGILTVTNPSADNKRLIEAYVDSWGLCVRHPNHYPSSNKWNFTKDQLKCLVAGLVAVGRHDLVRKIFWAHVLRLGFCQNFQRDINKTYKFPWPHSAQDLTRDNANDSRFYFKGEPEFRWFDFADPMLPNDWWFLIRGGRMWYFYWLSLVGIPFYILTLFIHAKSNHNEENQAVSEAFVLGDWFVRLYKKINQRWRHRSLLYWLTRKEIEYHEELEKFLNKY